MFNSIYNSRVSPQGATESGSRRIYSGSEFSLPFRLGAA
jgi:hypothetical protein